MKLLPDTKNELTKNDSDENVPHLEITEVVVVHCIIFNKDSQDDSRGLNIYVPNKLFG